MRAITFKVMATKYEIGRQIGRPGNGPKGNRIHLLGSE
jgi:hypothetical protein